MTDTDLSRVEARSFATVDAYGERRTVLTEGLEVFDGHKLEFCGVPLGRVVVISFERGGRCVVLSECVYVVIEEWSVC